MAPTLASPGIPKHHGGRRGDAKATLKSSRVNRKYKTNNRIRNWKEYERGLRSRGDVTIWLSDEAIAEWTPAKNGLRGGQRRFNPLGRRFHGSHDPGLRRVERAQQQARVENGFFRYKSVLRDSLKARNSNAQKREAMIGCHTLNRMAELSRPESYAVVS